MTATAGSPSGTVTPPCIGVAQAGRWRERLNSDAADYGGSGQGNQGALETQPQPAHGQRQSLLLRLPPLALLILTPG